MMQKIYLIRHGATVANEQKLYCGRSDLPLSPGGLARLRQMAARGGYPDPAGKRLITSGMQRTEQTLEALFGPREHEVQPAFREIDFGAFEMHSYEQLKDDPAYQAWLDADPERTPPPGGESGEQMKRRVLRALRPVLETDRDTVIVTHGGVIAAVMESLFPEEGKNRYQWQPKPGRGYAVTGKTYSPIP